MFLGNLHDNYAAHTELNDAAGNPATTYLEARDNMIKSKENARLFVGPGRPNGIAVSLIHDDSAGIPTIGYGFNLRDHTAVQIRSVLTYALGGALTPDQEQGLQIIEAWKNNTAYNGTNFTEADILDLALGRGGLAQHQALTQSIALTEAQSTTLLHAYLDGHGGLSAVDGAFGLDTADSVGQSTERLALLDLRYAGLLGKGIKGAVAGNGQTAESPRAAAWFEARYKHGNTGGALQTRRAMESRLIGLVQEGLNNKETLQETLVAVSYLYKHHYDLIKQRDGRDNFEAAISSEKALIEAAYTEGNSIDFIQTTNANGAIDIAPQQSGVARSLLNDLMVGDDRGNNIDGGDGNDYLYGGAGVDKLHGGEGNDYLDGGIGNDNMSGGNGADTIYGGEGDDRLEAGAEDVYGEGAINILQGGADNDTLIGGDGIDLLYGGTGDDTLFVDRGGFYVAGPIEGHFLGWEYMNGGAGFDTYYIGTASNYNIIADSDGLGEIYVKASDIGDQTYKLTGGGFWGEQSTSQGLEADGYTQIHADGSTSNFTVAYELDNSQTLIGYGFNIYNFYNGMLGINLVGGRVSSDPVTVNDVLEKLVFDDAFEPEEIERIKNVIKDAYEKSPIARKMLRGYAVAGGNDINMFFSEGGFASSSGPRENTADGSVTTDAAGIYIDLNWLENNTYISTNGKAVADTLETALIHELVHLTQGLTDTNNPGEKGETVEFANTIYKEMGLAEQASYLAYDTTGNTHVTDFEYTQGQEIDRAFTLRSEGATNNIDSSLGDFKDLIIGNERANILISGAGDDFLYGGAGNDELSGGDGADYLVGGADDDRLYGGEGDDTIIGGEGEDYLEGGEGYDTYVFNYNDGIDYVDEYLTGNAIKFGEGITASDLRIEYTLEQTIISLLIDGVQTGDSIIIEDTYENNAVTELLFESGDSVTWDPIEKKYDSEEITHESGIPVYNHEYDNVIFAKGPESPLYGTADNDLFIGDIGLHTYYIGAWEGHDFIRDTGNFYRGTVNISNLPESAVWAVQDDNDMVINVADGSVQSIRIDDHFLSEAGIAKVVFKNDIFNDEGKVIGTTYSHYYSNFNSNYESYSNYGNTQIYRYDMSELFSNGPHREVIRKGTDSSDTLIGSDADETIDGKEGDDNLNGGKGDDTYIFSQGDDTISDDEGSNRVHFGSGWSRLPTLRSYSDSNGRLVYEVNGSSVTIEVWQRIIKKYTQGGRNSRFAEADNTGSWTFSFSDGTEWNEIDIIARTIATGTDGDDTINYQGLTVGTGFEGGLGNDTILGGLGNDTYYFNLGDGQDILSDNQGGDKIVFSEGITAENLRITLDVTESHWIVELIDENGDLTGDKITVENAFNNIDYQLESFEFSDGSSMTLEQIQQVINEQETTIKLEGTNTDDVLIGGAENETLIGYEGNDILDGGVGDDTYIFNLGDGNDVIKDVKGNDTLRFGTGITADNITIEANATDMFIRFESGEVLTIDNWYSGNSSRIENIVFDDGSSLDTAQIIAQMDITGSDGDDVINHRYQIHNQGVNYALGDGNDTLNAGGGDDVLNGGLGDDMLDGGNGDDTYIFNLGDGNDVIKDARGNDTLRFGAGITADNITIEANATDMFIRFESGEVLTIDNWYSGNSSRIENIVFDDGSSLDTAQIIAQMDITGSDGDDVINHRYQIHNQGVNYALGDGNDTLNAGGGDDVLNGGLGDDMLDGGNGDDTYIFNLGDGNDVIKDARGNDTLRFGAGITADNITIEANATDMFIRFESGEVLTIDNWYSGNSSRIENIVFDDGSSLDTAQIIAQMDITGSDGDDVINHRYQIHNQGVNYALGDGNDTLNAGGGDDVLNGGLGDDMLDGGNGDDTYIFNLGDGNDVIKDSRGNDTLRFGAGITADNITIEANATDMFIRFESGEVLTIDNWYSGNSSRIENIVFDDGSSLDTAQIIAQMDITGSDGDDVINHRYQIHNQGVNYALGDGNDTLNAGGGDDVLNGGLGDDMLDGGNGDDTYIFNLGDGNDVIKDSRGNDTLRFGAGITADNITIEANATDMFIRFESGEVLTIDNWYSGNSSRIENIVFDDGSSLDTAQIIAQMDITGSDGDDVINHRYQIHNQDVNYALGNGNDTLVEVIDKRIIDPGWLPQPVESIVSLTNGELSGLIDANDTLVEVIDKRIIDPGWLPQPAESIVSLTNGELSGLIDANDTLLKVIDKHIIDPGWLPQPVESIVSLTNGELSGLIDANDTLVEVIDKRIIDPGWLPQPVESIVSLTNGELFGLIDANDTLVEVIDKRIIDPGWLPQPAESIETSVGTELDSAFNQLVQAHSSFSDVSDETSFDKKDDGYRYILPVPEPLI